MHLTLFQMIGGAAGMLALSVTVNAVQPQSAPSPDTGLPAVQTVVLPAGTLSIQLAGEFLANGRPVAPPQAETKFRRPLEIMAYQVSAADYGRCVAEAACKPLDKPATDPALPATGVSYDDAAAYATWYTRRTGESWRLPTDAEWAYAAAERFAGEPFSGADDPSNPAVAWIRNYWAEAERGRAADPQPKPAGFYGANANGLYDVAGNVWEWTSTCYARTALAEDGRTAKSVVENCRVHAVEGRHRTYMSNFVREGSSGGCSVGTPPDNLGFRLVREQPRLVGLANLRRLVGNAFGEAH